MITKSHIHGDNGLDLPLVCLARHGETAWTPATQHAGPTHLPRTKQGERQMRKLRATLRGLGVKGLLSRLRGCCTAKFAMRESRYASDDKLVGWGCGASSCILGYGRSGNGCITSAGDAR